MTFLEQYGYFVQEFIILLVSSFLIIGSVVVFKSKRIKTKWLLLASSVMIVITTIVRIYINTIAFGILNDSHDDNFEGLVKIMSYNHYVYIFFSAVFAFAFAALCCSFADMRKRNEELEFLTKELAERD
jgi:carbon starvation protein CstA